MSIKEENSRKLIEVALTTGRHFQSTQTGFIHFNHFHVADHLHHTIPLYENALFILALFRSKTVENIREAQDLLTRLLAFQANEGNFPTYLHEFPLAQNFSTAIHMLTPFYWILKNFGHILGQPLRSLLENSMKSLVYFLVEAVSIKEFPFALKMRLAATLIVNGKHFKDENLIQKAQNLLDELYSDLQSDNWCGTEQIADILIALSLCKQAFDLEKLKPLLSFIANSWHREANMYCGPAIYEHQNEYLPVFGLYELYMGYLADNLMICTTPRTIKVLEGALVYPIDYHFETNAYPVVFEGSFQQARWVSLKNSQWTLSLLEKNLNLEDRFKKTYTSFCLKWGKDNSVHSLVCQGGNAKHVTYKYLENHIELVFELDFLKENDYESSREITFFIDIPSKAIISTSPLRTSIFQLGQNIQFSLPNEQKIGMTFELLEGEGNFIGHIAQANRPAQLKKIDAKKFDVYDWIIFLRSLRRAPQCKIKVCIDLSQFESL